MIVSRHSMNRVTPYPGSVGHFHREGGRGRELCECWSRMIHKEERPGALRSSLVSLSSLRVTQRSMFACARHVRLCQKCFDSGEKIFRVSKVQISF